MDDVRISIAPTEHTIASCNGCFAQNYKSDHMISKYVQDLYDVRIGSTVLRLCPNCLGVLEQKAGHMLRNRALPEVFAIVKGNGFSLQIVKGKMENIDAGARVIVKIDALTESVYTFKTEDIQRFIFDTQSEAEAQLAELTTHPIN